jgi:hypothetical protein
VQRQRTIAYARVDWSGLIAAEDAWLEEWVTAGALLDDEPGVPVHLARSRSPQVSESVDVSSASGDGIIAGSSTTEPKDDGE